MGGKRDWTLQDKRDRLAAGLRIVGLEPRCLAAPTS